MSLGPKRSWMISYLINSLFAGLSAFTGHAVSPPTGNPVPERMDEIQALYSSIQFDDSERPDSAMFHLGIKGFRHLDTLGQLSDKGIIALVDFTKPSSEKRMWIIDLKNRKVLYHLLVAHGKNSGELYASSFSNKPNSYQSSLGLFITGEIYNGKNGKSLKLRGMQKELNGRAEERAIVIHGAEYVSDAFVKQVGRLGRSYGCPAIPMEVHEEVINLLAGGTLLFLYSPVPSMSLSLG
jgi:hypothetical protein